MLVSRVTSWLVRAHRQRGRGKSGPRGQAGPCLSTDSRQIDVRGEKLEGSCLTHLREQIVLSSLDTLLPCDQWMCSFHLGLYCCTKGSTRLSSGQKPVSGSFLSSEPTSCVSLDSV